MRGGTSCASIGCGRYVVLYLFVGAFACVGKCRPCRAHCRIGRLRCCVVVLCSLNVFGCVNGLLRSFVFLFDCDCMVCGIEGGLFGGIDYWCGRAMSPFRAMHTFDFKSLKNSTKRKENKPSLS